MGGGRKNQKEVKAMKHWRLKREGSRWVVKPYWAMPFIPLYKARIIEFWLTRAEYPIRPYRVKPDGREVPAYGIGTLEWNGWLVALWQAIGSLVDRAKTKIKAIRKPKDMEDIPF